MDNPDVLKLFHRHSVWMIRISVRLRNPIVCSGLLLKQTQAYIYIRLIASGIDKIHNCPKCLKEKHFQATKRGNVPTQSWRGKSTVFRIYSALTSNGYRKSIKQDS
jgi:hypothetical protein